MSVGLDLGSSQFRCLRQVGDQLKGRAAKAVFASLPDAPEFRSVLMSAGIPFAVCEEALTIVGDHAADYSMLFHVRPQSLLPQGRMPTNNPVARQSLAALVDALLGKPDQPGEMCGVTLPGGESFQSLATSGELEFFSRLIRLRGFSPLVLPSGMALILAELVRHSFTGVGLSFGASTSELVVAHRGVELAICSLPQGGNWLDEQIANAFNDTYRDEAGDVILDPAQGQRRRHDFDGNLQAPKSTTDKFFASLHEDLLYALMRSAKLKLLRAPHALEIPQPVPVVVGGGVARIRGFESLLRSTLNVVRFPLAVREIYLANDQDFTVARGCLIHAQLESEIRATRTRAA